MVLEMTKRFIFLCVCGKVGEFATKQKMREFMVFRQERGGESIGLA
jgi:hypothetical protein